MNKLIQINIILLLSFFCTTTFAQQIGNLEGINYQAVAIDENGKEIVGMDVNGKPLYNKEIGVRFSITQGTETILYQETHTANTDQQGLFSLVIGKGDQTGAGPYSRLMDIPWIEANQYLKVEISIKNDDNYKLVSLQKFMAVPYSFYTDDIADNAITSAKILDNNVFNEDIADETIDLTQKVTAILPVANGGTGKDSFTAESVLIGDGANPVKTLTMPDSAQILTNLNGSTELYSLKAGPRTSISYNDVDKTVTITALDQATSNSIAVGTNQSTGNIPTGGQVKRVYPTPGGTVQLGDIIISSINKDLNGVTMTAYVSASDEVTFIFYNGTGTVKSLSGFDIQIFNLGQ